MDGRDGSSPPQPKMDPVDSYNQESPSDSFSDAEKVEKKRGGWRAVTFILGTYIYFWFVNVVYFLVNFILDMSLISTTCHILFLSLDSENCILYMNFTL